MKLATLLDSLKIQPRPLTDEENLYLVQITESLSQVEGYDARWRILEREGLRRLDGMALFESLILKLAAAQCAALK
jgi:hypothetical protein